MNERIKELMLEAGYAAPEIALRAQKLAELVVKECINALPLGMEYKQYDIAVMSIKAHFGVE